MVCVEMSFLLVELHFLTDVDDRLAQAFRVTGLPIRTMVIVGQVGNDKPRGSDLSAQLSIEDASLPDIKK